MEKGKLIGRGMTAEVFEWDNDKVIKLFFERYDEDWVKFEASKSSMVHDSGVPSPAVFGTASLDDRNGIILERICGKPIPKLVQAEPWKLYLFAQKLAKFHYKIHQHSADGLPSQKERFTYAINRSSKLPGDKRKKIFDYIDSLPNGTNICHGDLHFNNVIISGHKLVAIDWSSAYQGNPLGDVARTCLMMSSPTNSLGSYDLMSIIAQYAKWQACWTYLNEYMKLSKVQYKDIDAWMLPVAAAKLKDKVREDEKWLMQIINERLERYKL